MNIKNIKISIIGLGYVGLPVALAFGKKFDCIGYDLNVNRIKQLQFGKDMTKEISRSEIKRSKKINFTSNINKIDKSDFFIITVPTPILESKQPDLSHISDASEKVAKFIKKGSIIIYESTVYPGLVEEFCGPIIEKVSKLKLNRDFSLGYSPERINPGDKIHTLTKIVKVTSGSNSYASRKVDDLYKSIITAGTYRADSIKVAEAAKVIENTQRDLNIALMNELSQIFSKMNISSKAVLDAASTKWNFQKFKPGLVGGHCIGVDPYYLTFKARKIGINPKIILAGRKTNDEMAKNISKKIISKMKSKRIEIKGSRVLILGYTFKENCSDIRNTKVADMKKYFQKNLMECFIYDPNVNHEEFKKNKCMIKKFPQNKKFDAVVLAVNHDQFKSYPISKLLSLLKKVSVLFDLQNLIPKKYIDGDI